MRRSKTDLALNGSLIFAALLSMVADTVAGRQELQGFEGLIELSEAVVAVEILSADYSATPHDGPMVASAKILKVVKGSLNADDTLTFAETAWVGPAYQKAELRILFLKKIRPAESHQPAQWRILFNLYARTDFFIEKESVSSLSSESLEAFLKRIQQLKPKPKQVVFAKQ